ncbi:MAG: alpha/beta hydrolase [Clostridia bacterium]|nr:alpha/beta hydrolase [Clostridia bacterium]
MNTQRTITLWQETPPGFTDSYGQPAPSITLYPVEGSKGIVLVLAGGGYHYKADHEGAPIARRINQGGISAAVLDYRVTPYHAPVPQWDALRAVQLLRSLAPEYGYQSDRIAILGFSAGGHLAASTSYLEIDLPGTTVNDPLAGINPLPNAAVLCYPVITLGAYTHQGSRDNLLGMNASAELAAKWSVERHIKPDACPAFIWHTADDGAVPIQNSLMLAAALAEQKVPFSLHIWPHGSHGLGLAENTEDIRRWPDLMIEWLRAQGY